MVLHLDCLTFVQFGPVPVPVGPRREQFMPQTSGVLPGAGIGWYDAKL